MSAHFMIIIYIGTTTYCFYYLAANYIACNKATLLCFLYHAIPQTSSSLTVSQKYDFQKGKRNTRLRSELRTQQKQKTQHQPDDE